MDINVDLFDEEVRREIARRSLHELIQYINPEYITSYFSEMVCASLDNLLIEMMTGKHPDIASLIQAKLNDKSEPQFAEAYLTFNALDSAFELRSGV